MTHLSYLVLNLWRSVSYIVVIVSVCLQTGLGHTLTVFAAASLSNSFTTIGEEFDRLHPDAKMQFNFAGSQELAQQVLHGASADVFASADEHQMRLVGDLVILPYKIFARNTLVVIVPRDNPAKLVSFADLATQKIKVIIAAKEVPVGNYTLRLLDNASRVLGSSFVQGVFANVVSYEQNVRAVLTKISLGEADAGIVYVSDANVASAKIETLPIPDSLNIAAEYPIAVLKTSKNATVAQQFVDFILSIQGQAILQKHGFITHEDQ